MANEISSADISANQTFGTAGIYRQENLKERLLEVLRDDPTAFQWLEGLNFTLNAFGLLIGFVHNYFAFWFRDHKRPIFENALGEIFAGSLPRLLYQWPDNSEMPEMPEIPELPAPPPLELPLDTGGDPFADLVFNQKNSFAFEAARRAANTALYAEGCDYAILVLCGPSGVGKSFLLSAIHKSLCRQEGASRVVFRNAASFCAEMFPAMQKTGEETFWRTHQAILLDDMQEIWSYDSWQERLCALIDVGLRDNSNSAMKSRRLVFAHLGGVAEMSHLKERLRSRLESGLVVELFEPDLDVRLRYLEMLAKKKKLGLGREQMLFLARRASQFRMLQGLARKVEAYMDLNGKSPSQDVLENLVKTGNHERVTSFGDIVGLVSRGFNLAPEDILGTRRKPDFVLARQVAMYLCRRKLGLSYPELGKAFGRDHSTVIHAIKKIQALPQTDKVLHKLVTDLENAAC